MWIFPSLSSAQEGVVYLQSLNQLRLEISGPNRLRPNISRVVKFGSGLALLANYNDADAAAFKGASGQETDTAVPTWSKVDGVSSSSWEVAGLDPVNRRSENLVAKGSGQ
jgi:hypothetical protein